VTFLHEVKKYVEVKVVIPVKRDRKEILPVFVIGYGKTTLVLTRT
jgi:hypothetical protein